MSKHAQNIFFKVRVGSVEQRTRLNQKVKEVSIIMEKENAETLELLLDHALPHFPISMDRTPMERRMGAIVQSETEQEQSGTSQGRRKRADSGVTPHKTQDA